MVVKWFAGAVAPREGQGEQPHHFGQARGVGEVGILEVEAPGFEASEQGFNGLITNDKFCLIHTGRLALS